jgi:hypothetical protein
MPTCFAGDRAARPEAIHRSANDKEGRGCSRRHLRVQPVNSAREDMVELYTCRPLTLLGLSDHDLQYCCAALEVVVTRLDRSLENDRQRHAFRAARLDGRLSRLADGHLGCVRRGNLRPTRRGTPLGALLTRFN